jgi:hypothetical protein
MTEPMKDALWLKLGKTDPAQTKAFNRAGGFRGTAVKPMWVMQRLTEEFGPCGVGWGVDEPKFEVVQAGGEVLIYCTVGCWHGQMQNTLYGVGGDKVSAKRGDGVFNDDEAFKKAYTDAIMNAFKFIGVAADVHMGRFDDNKYVQSLKDEFAPTAPRQAPANGLGTEKRDTGAGSIDGIDWWGCSGPGLSPAEAKRQGMDKDMEEIRHSLRDAPTKDSLRDVVTSVKANVSTMPHAWRTLLREEADTRLKELEPK